MKNFANIFHILSLQFLSPTPSNPTSSLEENEEREAHQEEEEEVEGQETISLPTSGGELLIEADIVQAPAYVVTMETAAREEGAAAAVIGQPVEVTAPKNRPFTEILREIDFYLLKIKNSLEEEKTIRNQDFWNLANQELLDGLEELLKLDTPYTAALQNPLAHQPHPHTIANASAGGLVAQNMNLANQSSYLKLLSKVFELLRNLVAKSSINQENARQSAAISCFRMGIQMLSNTMTDSRTVQADFWPYFAHSPLLGMALDRPDPKTVRSCLVWIYNCTHHNHEQSLLLMKFPNGLGVLGKILDICENSVDLHDDMNFELGIAIITSVVEIDSLPVLYRSLRSGESSKITLLKIMDGLCHAIIESKGKIMYISTSIFLIDLLDEILDQTIHTQGEDTYVINENEAELKNCSLKLFYVLQFWKFVTEEPMAEYGLRWAKHGLVSTLSKSLLYLNKVFPAAATLRGGQKNDYSKHPLFMLKSDIIKVISNLAFWYSDYKEYFRDTLPLVLANCIVDDMNPYIRESSLFCIRNLVTGSTANQELVAAMEAKGIAPAPVLDELGFHVSLNEDMKKLQIERK